MRCPYCRTSETFLVKLTKSALLRVVGEGHVKSQEENDMVDILCDECGQVIVGADKKTLLKLIHDAGEVVGEFEFLPKE